MVNNNVVVANTLKTVFAENQIYHGKAPMTGSYPMVVYDLLSYSPALHADNSLYGYRVTYRITVIDKIERFDLAETIRKAFRDWHWEGTNTADDEKEVFTVVDISNLEVEQ